MSWPTFLTLFSYGKFFLIAVPEYLLGVLVTDMICCWPMVEGKTFRPLLVFLAALIPPFRSSLMRPMLCRGPNTPDPYEVLSAIDTPLSYIERIDESSSRIIYARYS